MSIENGLTKLIHLLESRWKLLLSCLVLIITGGAGQIAAYYAGYFFLFGYDSLTFFSFSDIKNDAIREAWPYFPVFIILFGVSCYVYLVSVTTDYKLDRYISFIIASLFLCMLAKMLTILVESHEVNNLLASSKAFFARLMTTFEGRLLMFSGTLTVLITAAIMRRTRGVEGIILKITIIYCLMMLLICTLGYGRGILLAIEPPDTKIRLTNGERLEVHILMAGASGVLAWEGATKPLRYLPTHAIVDVNLRKQKGLDRYRQRYLDFVRYLSGTKEAPTEIEK